MIADTKLYEVAYAYYIQGRRQQDIAKELGVSHVQISKYLKLAEEKGIVEITVNPPYVSNAIRKRLKDFFLEKFGLENLVLVPEARSEQNKFAFLVKGSMDYLLSTYSNDALNIGFGLGRTMTELSQSHVKVADKRNRWKYYPVPNYRFSRDNRDNEYFGYLGIAQNFTKYWGGSIDKSFSRLADTDNGDSVIANLVDSDIWSSLDVVIGGVGIPLSREPNVREMVFGHDLAKQLASKDIRGDYLNYFFDSEGQVHISEKNAKYMIPLETIKKVPRKIAVACGYQKVLSILGLLECRIVDTLITDVETARLIMGYLR